MAAELVHATAIAMGGRAVLIRGPSGAGKSDLALRCMALGPSPLLWQTASLISDDQVKLECRERRLYASAPEQINGLLEIRGLGIHRVSATAAETQVTLAVDLLAPHDPPAERYPDPWPLTLCQGVYLPLLRLQAFEASAPLKVLLALQNGLAGSGPSGR